MKKLALFALVNVLLIVIGCFIVLESLNALPKATQAAAPQISAQVNAFPQSSITAWKDAISRGRSALINSTPVTVDGNAPASAEVKEQIRSFASAFDHPAECKRQIELFNNELASRDLRSILDTLNSNGALFKALTAPNLLAALIKVDPANTKLLQAFDKSNDPENENRANPFALFLARLTAIDVINEPAEIVREPAQPTLKDFERRVELCTAALKQFAHFKSMPKKRDSIEKSLLTAQEQVDWHVASNDAGPRNDTAAIGAYTLYIKKYKSPQFKPFAIHIGDAEEKLAIHNANVAWDALLPTLPNDVQLLAKNPQQQLKKGTFNGVVLKVPILALHQYCVDHPIDKNRLNTCKAVSTRLMQYLFENDEVLAPTEPSELKTVTIRRDVAEFVGFVVDKETDHQLVTMTDPNDKSKKLRFFQAGLMNVPDYIEESKRDREYMKEFRTSRELLANPNQVVKAIAAFEIVCQELAADNGNLIFKNRLKIVEALHDIIKNCPQFF